MGALASALTATVVPAAHAAGATPSAVFVQQATGEDAARATLVGLSWDFARHGRFWGHDVSSYIEAGIGRWSAPGESSVTQIGITPVVRLRPDAGASRWFYEAGIGAEIITPRFRTDDRRFSSTLNFGTHIALGFDFGASRQHELSLRAEHFSNAGLRRPNPGENFLQLRYAFRFE